MVHLPLLRNPDQSKLSKRKNPTSITYYRDAGYLPEALLNYLALMGWSMPDESEIFSRQQMVDAFDLQRISVRGPIFDQTKLAWMNGQYLRSLSPQVFADTVVGWLTQGDRLQQLVPLVQERVERLSDLAPLVDYLVGARKPLTADDLQHKSLSSEDIVRVLHHTLARFDEQRNWQRDELFSICEQLAAACEMKFRDFLFPLFVAISGRGVSLPLFDSMQLLGADLSRARLRDALEVMQVSGKQRKKLDKAYAALEQQANRS